MKLREYQVKNKIFIRSKLDKRKRPTNENNIINISSVTGAGIDSLLRKLKKKLVKNNNNPILSRERHINIMKNILKELKLINFNDNFDILAFRLREAFKYSLEINQTFDIDDILDIIFKDYCIGK